MEVRFEDGDLERLYRDPQCRLWPVPIAKAFRKVMQWIDAAKDERDLYAFKSLHFEKLHGTDDRSMRLNDQYRLIVEIEKGNPKNTVVIKSITDYH